MYKLVIIEDVKQVALNKNYSILLNILSTLPEGTSYEIYSPQNKLIESGITV